MLAAPMLARPDPLPRGDDAYEVKWDGLGAIVATEDGLQVRSRRLVSQRMLIRRPLIPVVLTVAH